MGYTVVHPGELSARADDNYLVLVSRMLYKRGVPFDHVPRTPDIRPSDHWLYVWDSEDEARAFAEQIRETTEDPTWEVRPVPGPPSMGPLRPIDIRVGREVDAWTFGLDSLVTRAIQLRFPGPCQNEGVSIHIPHVPERKADWPKSQDGVRSAVEHVLPLLTGLRLEHLSTFGSYRVLDPVTLKVIVPPTSILAAVDNSQAPSSAAVPAA
jgi:hypothetical protein